MFFRFLLVFFFLSCNSPTKDVVQNFQLQDLQDGEFNFYSSQQNKKLSLIFFGYSHCPNVCYNILHKFDLIIKYINPEVLKKVQFIFISIDSKNDSKDRLRLMSSNFNSQIIYLRGNNEELQQIQNNFKVKIFPSETKNEDGSENLIHTTFIFVVNNENKIINKFPEEANSDLIIKFLNSYLY